jgi:hypothetical protein
MAQDLVFFINYRKVLPTWKSVYMAGCRTDIASLIDMEFMWFMTWQSCGRWHGTGHQPLFSPFLVELPNISSSIHRGTSQPTIFHTNPANSGMVHQDTDPPCTSFHTTPLNRLWSGLVHRPTMTPTPRPPHSHASTQIFPIEYGPLGHYPTGEPSHWGDTNTSFFY